METLIKSDIFFFITSVSIVFISALLIVASVYLIKILKDLKHVSKILKEEGEEIVEDIKDIRLNLKEKGLKFSSLFDFISKVFKIKKRGSKKISKD